MIRLSCPQCAAALKAPAAAAGFDRDQEQRPTGPRSTIPRFSAFGKGWGPLCEKPLARDERPNPAFRDMYPTAGSTLWLNPKGRDERFPSAPAVALMTGRDGLRTAERGLENDVYRASINSDGSGVVFLSRSGVLHGYSERLDPIFAERLEQMPEYAAQAGRFGIQPHE